MKQEKKLPYAIIPAPQLTAEVTVTFNTLWARESVSSIKHGWEDPGSENKSYISSDVRSSSVKMSCVETDIKKVWCTECVRSMLWSAALRLFSIKTDRPLVAWTTLPLQQSISGPDNSLTFPLNSPGWLYHPQHYQHCSRLHQLQVIVSPGHELHYFVKSGGLILCVFPL